eukprot:Nk52_evm36s163 gene=Nk52_evmTU36s163
MSLAAPKKQRSTSVDMRSKKRERQGERVSFGHDMGIIEDLGIGNDKSITGEFEIQGYVFRNGGRKRKASKKNSLSMEMKCCIAEKDSGLNALTEEQIVPDFEKPISRKRSRTFKVDELEKSSNQEKRRLSRKRSRTSSDFMQDVENIESIITEYLKELNNDVESKCFEELAKDFTNQRITRRRSTQLKSTLEWIKSGRILELAQNNA